MRAMRGKRGADALTRAQLRAGRGDGSGGMLKTLDARGHREGTENWNAVYQTSIKGNRRDDGTVAAAAVSVSSMFTRVEAVCGAATTT